MIQDSIVRTYWEDIYSREQADREGLKYVYWRDLGNEPGWVLSDDGFVVYANVRLIKEVMYIRKDGSEKSRIRKRLFGKYFCMFPHGKREFLFNDGFTKKRSKYNPVYWWQEVSKGLIRELAVLYLGGLISIDGRHTVKAHKYYYKLGYKYGRGKDPLKRVIHIRYALENMEIQRMIREEARKILEEMGVTAKRPFELLAEAEGWARAEKDVKGMVAIVDRYGKMLGIPGFVSENGKGGKGKDEPLGELSSGLIKGILEEGKKAVEKIQEATIISEEPKDE